MKEKIHLRRNIKKNSFIFIQMLVLSIYFFANMSFAQNVYSQSLIKGKEAFVNKDYKSAIEYFTIALLEDSSNKSAEAQIRQILLKDSQMFNGERQRILLFLDKIEYQRFLRKQIEVISESSQRLANILVSETTEIHSDYHGAILGLMDRQRLSLRQIDFSLKFLNKVKIGSENFLAVSDQKLSGYNEKLEDIIEDLRDISNELSDYQRVVFRSRLHVPQAQKVNISDEIVAQLNEIRRVLAKKDVELENQNQKIEQLQDNLSGIKKEYSSLQKKVGQNNDQVEEMTQSLASLTLDNYEKEKIIADKKGKINHLEQSLAETRERLNLVQKIIEQKDSKIEKLSYKLGHVSEKSKQGLSKSEVASDQNNEEIDILRKNLTHLKSQMNKKSTVHEKKLVALEKSMSRLNTHYQNMEIVLFQKDVKIAKLREANGVKEKKIGRFERILAVKSRKLSSANNLADIYRERLIKALGNLKEKQLMIEALEKKLNFLKILEDNSAALDGESKDWGKNDPVDQSKDGYLIQSVDMDTILENAKKHLEVLNSSLNF